MINEGTPMQYTERPRTVEAMRLTVDAAPEVAAWCGGMALGDGSVLYPVGDVWLTAPVTCYVVRDGEQLSHMDGDTFEGQWAATSEATNA